MFLCRLVSVMVMQVTPSYALNDFTWDILNVHFFFTGCEQITDILSYYNIQSPELVEVLGERDFKTLTAFIFQTVLPHFKLFQYVFNVPRTEQVPNVVIKVEPPFDSSSLKESKSIKVWEYERHIDELEQKEQERLNERLKENEDKVMKLQSETENALQNVGKSETAFNAEVGQT